MGRLSVKEQPNYSVPARESCSEVLTCLLHFICGQQDVQTVTTSKSTVHLEPSYHQRALQQSKNSVEIQRTRPLLPEHATRDQDPCRNYRSQDEPPKCPSYIGILMKSNHKHRDPQGYPKLQAIFQPICQRDTVKLHRSRTRAVFQCL